MNILIPLIYGVLGLVAVVNGFSERRTVFARDQKYQDTPEASVLTFAKGMYVCMLEANHS